MTLTLIIQAVMAALKFPDAMSQFIRLISSTPEEKHDALVKMIKEQADSFKSTGRPS